MLNLLLVALTWVGLGLTLLSWLGRLRQHIQGELLAHAFRSELKRRGLINPAVLRT